MPINAKSQITNRSQAYHWLKHPDTPDLARLDSVALRHARDSECESCADEGLRCRNLFKGATTLFLIFAEQKIGPSGPGIDDALENAQKSILNFAKKYGAVEVPELRLGSIILEIEQMRATVLLWRAIKLTNAEGDGSDHLWDFYWNMVLTQSNRHREKKGDGEWNNDSKTSQGPKRPIERWRQEFSDIFSDEFGLVENLAPIAPTGSTELATSQSQDNQDAELAWAKNLLVHILKNRIGDGWNIEILQGVSGILEVAVSTSILRRVLWLQLALAIAENRGYRHCEACLRLFVVSDKPDRRQERSDKKYCCDNCRVNGLHKRKKRAKALLAEGKSIAEIAKEINTDEDTVKNWIKGTD